MYLLEIRRSGGGHADEPPGDRFPELGPARRNQVSYGKAQIVVSETYVSHSFLTARI